MIEDLERLQRALAKDRKPHYRSAQRPRDGHPQTDETKRKIGNSVRAFAKQRARQDGICTSQTDPHVPTALSKTA